MWDAEGHLILPVAVIFQGMGKRVNATEQALFDEYSDSVAVFWQKKAWIDGVTEVKVLKAMLGPRVAHLKEKHGNDTECILVEDNVSAHRDPKALSYAKDECSTYVQFLPPGQTNYAQTVDDNCGKDFRSCVYSLLDEFHDEFDWEGNPSGKMTKSSKRTLCVELIAKVAQMWVTSDEKIDLAKQAARRTGLRMTKSGENPQPVRFPDNFGLSLNEGYDYIPFGPNEVVEEEDVCDGWSSEEEDRIWLADEIDSDENSADEVITTSRVRGCLLGCVCEKERGRLCTCEQKLDGLCHSGCGCDKSRCRAWVAK